MDQSRPVKVSREFQCDQCGSLYDVEFVALAERACDEAICQTCRMVMNEWRGAFAPIYKLKSPPQYA